MTNYVLSIIVKALTRRCRFARFQRRLAEILVEVRVVSIDEVTQRIRLLVEMMRRRFISDNANAFAMMREILLLFARLDEVLEVNRQQVQVMVGKVSLGLFRRSQARLQRLDERSRWSVVDECTRETLVGFHRGAQMTEVLFQFVLPVGALNDRGRTTAAQRSAVLALEHFDLFITEILREIVVGNRSIRRRRRRPSISGLRTRGKKEVSDGIGLRNAK